jgi:hypothetical protein
VVVNAEVNQTNKTTLRSARRSVVEIGELSGLVRPTELPGSVNHPNICTIYDIGED